MKELPVLFTRKEECCGCTACCSVCPAGAIEMREDEEGFAYPHILAELCLRCYQCLEICPMGEKAPR